MTRPTSIVEPLPKQPSRTRGSTRASVLSTRYITQTRKFLPVQKFPSVHAGGEYPGRCHFSNKLRKTLELWSRTGREASKREDGRHNARPALPYFVPLLTRRCLLVAVPLDIESRSALCIVWAFGKLRQESPRPERKTNLDETGSFRALFLTLSAGFAVSCADRPFETSVVQPRHSGDPIAEVFPCHGPDAKARRAKLRLDHGAIAIADRGGSAAIVPGKAASSEVMARVLSDNPGEVDAACQTGRSGSRAEARLLRDWIDQGRGTRNSGRSSHSRNP